MNLGVAELLIILAVVLLLFGATRLPKLARSLGDAKREFEKTGIRIIEKPDGFAWASREQPIQSFVDPTTEPVDGLWMDKAGQLYLSSIADNAVKALNPDGTLREVLQDARLRWPDTFSQGPDGAIYITASHIQDSPWFHPTGRTDKNFALFKFFPDSGATTGSSSRGDSR